MGMGAANQEGEFGGAIASFRFSTLEILLTKTERGRERSLTQWKVWVCKHLGFHFGKNTRKCGKPLS